MTYLRTLLSRLSPNILYFLNFPIAVHFGGNVLGGQLSVTQLDGALGRVSFRLSSLMRQELERCEDRLK